MKNLKHLKIFENIDETPIIDIIRDILIYIKDDYDGITGQIKTYKQNSDIKLSLNVRDVKFKGLDYSIERVEDVNKFLKDILDTCIRLEEATNLEIKVLNLYTSLSVSNEILKTSNPIEIFICEPDSPRDKLLSKK